MAEISTSIYFKAAGTQQQKELVAMFKTGLGDRADLETRFREAAAILGGDDASEAARRYLDDVENNIHEHFSIEGVSAIHGFCRADFICGHGAQKFALSTLRLLDELSPDITLRAWGTGDEDPWEFWVKRENGQSTCLEDSPETGRDRRIFGTVYRWWHEGMPVELREGLINEADLEDNADDEDPEVTDLDYERWLKRLRPKNDLERMAAEAANEEVTQAFVNSISNVFFGKPVYKTKTSPDAGAITAEVLTEENIRSLFDDMDKQTKAGNLDGIMRHHSKKMKARIRNANSKIPFSIPMNYKFYRMAFKMTLLPELDYRCNQEIRAIDIDGDTAEVHTVDKTSVYDSGKKRRVEMVSEDHYNLALIDGKVLITKIQSKQREVS